MDLEFHVDVLSFGRQRKVYEQLRGIGIWSAFDDRNRTCLVARTLARGDGFNRGTVEDLCDHIMHEAYADGRFTHGCGFDRCNA